MQKEQNWSAPFFCLRRMLLAKLWSAISDHDRHDGQRAMLGKRNRPRALATRG